MTSYPNREHENAGKAARRRDLTVLGTLRDVREWHQADAATAAGEESNG